MDRDTLVQAILDLENDRYESALEPEVAYEVAHHCKSEIDALAALERAALPDSGNGADPARGRRKRRKKSRRNAPDGPAPELASLPPAEQARWIFMERYIPLEKHEEILGCSFEPERFAEYQQGLDRLVRNLLLLPRSVGAVEKNDLPALQKLFASCVLIFRGEFIADEQGQPVPCSFESLRDHYPSYFYKRRKKPNWFERHDFYTEARAAPGWVMCDTDYLNCTLRRPERKLASYARDWGLPEEAVQHKALLDDIYDRIVCGEALEEDLFARNCNAVTRTVYRARRSHRIVYTIQRVHKITIHGRAGIPHWRATRRMWPGVYPTVSVDAL